jgi:hypothetical protein
MRRRTMKTKKQSPVAKVNDSLDYFGRCPHCGTYEDVLDVHSEMWVVCHTHRMKWLHSVGGWSPWWHDDEDESTRNWERIKDYEEIPA